ncbi:MAG: Hpt domain-containing protein [Bermanella sp.]
MSHLNLGQINELKDLMEDAFEDLINTYVEDSDEKIALLQSAINNKDRHKVAEISHSLKGSSANICAEFLSGLFKQVEDQARAENLTNIEQPFALAQDEYQQVRGELHKLSS